MAQSVRSARTRYPARAVLAVTGASVVFLFNMVFGFLFMALVPPMIPIYICILFSGACLLGSSLKYAQRVSVRMPAAMLQAGSHEKEVVEERASAARTT
jgi:hypothetical protein